MPFLTEELWHKLGTRGRDLIVSEWVRTERHARPTPPPAPISNG